MVTYLLKVVLPVLIMVFVWEDSTNFHSPRRNWWKGKMNMPDLKEYLMFEIANVFEKQDKRETARKKSAVVTNVMEEEAYLKENAKDDDDL